MPHALDELPRPLDGPACWRGAELAVRIYPTAERQTFHTDSCDIVGLRCLQTAKAGGESALVSSSTIWNQLRAQRPELARALLQPLATDRRGEQAPGGKPFFEIPVFNGFAGRMSAIYQRHTIDSAQRRGGVPATQLCAPLAAL